MANPTDLNPTDRAARHCAGLPVRLADGREWLLAHAQGAPGLDEVRDRMFDDINVRKHFKIADLMAAAFALLACNYNLSAAEARSLLAGVEPKALKEAVLACVMPYEEHGNRSVSRWARSALRANGIRPEDVPGEDLADVLDQLVRTGRAVPLDDFARSSGHAQMVRSILQGD